MFQRIVNGRVAPLKKMSRTFATAQGSFSKINANVDRSEVAAKYPLSQLSTLQNGLRVASEHVTGDMTTVGVFINAGSRYENDANNGVAHFAEHLFFKGTNKRTATQLGKEIEAIGGQLNAYTSRDQTVFLAKVFKKDVNQALDILGDIILNSKFSPEAINAERSVILREMQDVESRMQEVIYDFLHQTAYRGSSLGKTILGPKENIMKINREDIETYVKTHYTAPNMVVAAAGDIDHASFTASVEKIFSSVPVTPPNGILPVKTPAHYVGSEIRIRDDDLPAAHIAVGFETAGWKDADHIPLMVLQMMIGSYNRSSITSAKHASSPIVSFMANNDCAESVVPFNTVYDDTGLFGLYFIADAFDLDVGVRMGLDLLTSFGHDVNESQLAEAKNKLKLALFSQYENSDSVCEELGRQYLNYNRRIHPSELIARIDAVTTGDVQKVVQRFIIDKDPVHSCYGPVYEHADYNALQSRTWSRTI